MPIFKIPELIALASCLKTDNIDITSGCFDLLHPYHVEYLIRCKEQCGKLVVLIDSDRLKLVQKNKPAIQSERDRAYMVNTQAGIVDFVSIIGSIHQMAAVAEAFRDAGNTTSIFKNSNKIYNVPLLKVKGVSNIIIPDLPGYTSTTDLISIIKLTR